MNRLISLCLGLDLAGGVAGCLMVLPIDRLMGSHFGWPAHLQTCSLLLAFAMLLSVRSSAVGALRLHDRFRDGAAAATVTPVIRMLGALTAVSVGATAAGFLLAWAVAELATSLAYWLLVMLRSDFSWGSMRPSRLTEAAREHPGFWRFALFTNANSTLTSAMQQLAVIAVGFASGSSAAAFFRLANQLAQALLLVADMISRSLYAEIARISASQGDAAMNKLFGRTNRVALGGGLGVILLIVVAGQPALRLIGGAPYLPSYPLLVLLGSAAAVQLIGISFEPALMAQGRTGTILVVRTAAALLLMLLLSLLLPKRGALGGAIAVLAESAALMLLFMAAKRRASAQPARAVA